MMLLIDYFCGSFRPSVGLVFTEPRHDCRSFSIRVLRNITWYLKTALLQNSNIPRFLWVPIQRTEWWFLDQDHFPTILLRSLTVASCHGLGIYNRIQDKTFFPFIVGIFPKIFLDLSLALILYWNIIYFSCVHGNTRGLLSFQLDF